MTGKIFVISGPSGVGKGTVLDKLMESYSDINYSVSVTTRKPRKNEVHGEDYYFISENEFTEMKKNDELLESAEVHNNYYGTPRPFTEGCINRGEDVITELDIDGARQIREKFKDSILIFLVPPSFTELEERLDKRGSEDEKSKNIRLKNARNEVKEKVNYDYKIVNDNLEDTVAQLKEIIKKEKTR